MSRGERVFEVIAFPLVMGGAVAAGLAAVGAGHDPGRVSGVLTAAVGALILVLERRFPLHRSWLHSQDDLATDIAHAVDIAVVAGIAVGPVAAVWGIHAAGFLSDRFGSGLWPGTWPLLAQLPLALVLAELPKYWNHRLQHQIDFLWRFHATHHSAPRLYWLNAARFHPVDIFVDGLLGSVPLVALGAGIEVIALFNLVSGVHGYFQHANLTLRLGPLNRFFSMAELHRWHHSPVLAEANHNYGQNLSVWDQVFGTFFLPKDREPPEHIGIPDLAAFPMTFWAQIASPFTWRRIKVGSAAGRNQEGGLPGTQPAGR